MKIVYIISQAHSGSTLTDCILGTHPDCISSGELRYLNWQLKRTENTTPTIQAQNICTCEQDFRECPYWSKVFTALKQKTGKDIVNDPTSFDTAYFGKFSYADRGGFKVKFSDRIRGYLIRKWLESGFNLDKVLWIEPKIKTWLENNWILYESMAKVAQRPIVVDSSKGLGIALMLKDYKPQDVLILFIHRDIKGLAASAKKWSEIKGTKLNLRDVFSSKMKYEKTVKKIKKIDGINAISFDYEMIVSNPTGFLEEVITILGANKNYYRQSEDFFIDPSQQHMVAGNPMRYKGRQKVKYDDSWKTKLTDRELNQLENLYGKNNGTNGCS